MSNGVYEKVLRKGRQQKTIAIDNDTVLLPVQMATLDLSTHEHSRFLYFIGYYKIPLTKFKKKMSEHNYL
jgi:hypothetical protein